MKILIKKSFVTFIPLKAYNQHKEYEVSDEDAKVFIERGYAEEVSKKTKKVVEENTEEKPKKTKKASTEK